MCAGVVVVVIVIRIGFCIERDFVNGNALTLCRIPESKVYSIIFICTWASRAQGRVFDSRTIRVERVSLGLEGRTSILHDGVLSIQPRKVGSRPKVV